MRREGRQGATNKTIMVSWRFRGVLGAFWRLDSRGLSVAAGARRRQLRLALFCATQE
jgi:hypothetical protein